jgi:hypothetical protein
MGTNVILNRLAVTNATCRYDALIANQRSALRRAPSSLPSLGEQAARANRVGTTQ